MDVYELARTDPDAPALDDGTRRRTRGELVSRVGRLVTLFREHGIPPGGHAAMLVGNRVEFVEATLAATAAGVWLTPVNWHLAPEEAAYVVDDCQAGLVLVDPDHRSLASAAAQGRPAIELGAPLDDALDALPGTPLDRDAAPGGTMFYTSGTTGLPKGVRRSPRGSVGANLASAAAAGRALGLDGRGPHLVTGPLYHAAPLGFAVMDLHNGAEVVVLPRFDERATLEAIATRRVRNSHLVPTMFVRLLRLPEDERSAFDRTSLATVLHGAAPIAPAVKRSMIEWWGPVLVEYWGASEGGVVTLVSSEDWLAHPGTVGRPIANHEVWAGDDDGTPLPAGEHGLLWARNLAVADVFEYHHDPEKTARAFAGPGVYTLGDIGWVDPEGYVYLADRRSHMIISGGVNIYPAEVEAVLHQHPAVGDVAVFGVPDDEWGESVKAAVEPRAGVVWDEAIEASVLAFAREHLAHYKVPRSVDVHEHLPRADTGKLAVRRLRDPYWQGRDRAI